MGNNIRSSSRPKALAPSIPMPPLADAMDAVHLSVDRFCLLAGVEALAEMMEEDATTVCGARHRRHGDRRGYRWGRTHSEIGYHGGKVKVARPRVRDRAGKEVSLESWQALRDGNLLLEWALNLMVLNVSTRKYHRAVRLPEGDLAKARGDGTSKSAVSRRFVALSRKKMKAWLASDLSELDLLVIQIDGLHVGDHVLMAAIGVDGNGDKHVLAVVEGATENTVVVQALIDNLLARGLDPTLPRLFIVDGAKALSKAIRNTFGVAAAIQRCQVHKGRNIIERLPLHLHASVKIRQAWDQDDADKKAEIAKSRGADEAILYREVDFREAVMTATGGDSVDVVYDSVGKATFYDSIHCLRPRGLCVLFGHASGKIESLNSLDLSEAGSIFFTRPHMAHYIRTREELEGRSTAASS